MNRLKSVKTLYKYVTETDNNLLPDLTETTAEGFEWWQEIYNENTYAAVDQLFTRLYLHYIFYDAGIEFIEDYTDEEALFSFQNAVVQLFFKNQKKYIELYRIDSIPDDDAYALTNNYDLHETYSGTNANQGAVITGQRTDVNIDNTGSQNSAGMNKVTGWDSNSENEQDANTGTIGSRQDTHQFTKGQETDTNRSTGQDAHTLRRWGNIGVMTIQDMLMKQQQVWLPWSFLQIVFDDICKEYLLIGDDRVW